MRKNRIAAAAAAMCLIAGGIPAYTSYVQDTAYAEENALTQDIEFSRIGEVAELKLASGAVKAEWTSSDTNVAVVASSGADTAEITAVGAGKAVIYGVIGDTLLKYNVTVPEVSEAVVQHIGDITLNNTNNAAKADLKGIAKGTAEWSSSDEKVAKVDQEGNIIAVGKGSCVITAIAGEDKYTINVTSEYDPEAVIPTGSAEVFMETITLTNKAPKRTITAENLPEGTKLEWLSSDDKVAMVDQDGNIVAVGEGRCRVYVCVGSRRFIWDIVSEYDPEKKDEPAVIGTVKLTADSPAQQLSITGITDNHSVKWSSSDESIAVIDDEGVVTAQAKGTCSITADTGDKVYLIEIVSEYEKDSGENSTEIVLDGIGSTADVGIADITEAVSMNKDVAVISESGVITAVGAGETSVAVTAGGKTQIIKVKVTVKTVVGDANCDGGVTLADALAILQFVANEAKYPLSAQGMINAEAYGNDGITAKDSLAVQMYETGAVTELPIIEK